MLILFERRVEGSKAKQIVQQASKPLPTTTMPTSTTKLLHINSFKISLSRSQPVPKRHLAFACTTSFCTMQKLLPVSKLRAYIGPFFFNRRVFATGRLIEEVGGGGGGVRREKGGGGG